MVFIWMASKTICWKRKEQNGNVDLLFAVLLTSKRMVFIRISFQWKFVSPGTASSSHRQQADILLLNFLTKTYQTHFSHARKIKKISHINFYQFHLKFNFIVFSLWFILSKSPVISCTSRENWNSHIHAIMPLINQKVSWLHITTFNAFFMHVTPMKSV